MSRVSLQIFAIAGFVLVLFIGWDFSQRVMLTVRLQQTERDLDQKTADAQATHTALEELKKRVLTDEFVDRKMREDYHYVKDGETIVNVQITPAAPQAPAVELTPAPTALQSSWWQDLIEFLFGP